MGLLQSLIRGPAPTAATPENPRFSLNDAAIWDVFLGGEPSSTGIFVSPEVALTYAPWWRGINLLSGDVGKLSLHVYRTGTTQIVDNTHVAYPLIRRKPNTYQTAFQFRRQLTGHAVARGNGYAYIERDGAARPVNLWPLDPGDVSPIRENGRVLYLIRAKSEQRKLLAEDVLHIKGFGGDGLAGYSVVERAREQLGLAVASRKWEAISFRNSSGNRVILESDHPYPDDQKVKLRESWERMHTGLDNAHRTAILDRGLKARVLGFTAENSQFIERQQFGLVMIANFLGIPPHKIGDASRTGYASLEQENAAYLSEGLDPWLVTWEEECWDKLLTEEEKASEKFEIKFNRAEVIRIDAMTQANVDRIALAGQPFETVNEVRGRRNLPPLEGGDDLGIPANMGKPGGNPDFTKEETKPSKPATPGKKEKPDAIALANLEDATARMVRRIGLHAVRAAAEPKKFLAWLDRFAAEHRLIVATAFDAHEGGIGAADWFLEACREKYLDVSGRVGPADLREAITEAALELEHTLPGELCRIMGDQ